MKLGLLNNSNPMTKNEGTNDRVLRALLGLVLLAGGYLSSGGAIAIILYMIGVISLLTAITGFCGLYKLLGINTLKK
jgi:hypothetical protein